MPLYRYKALNTRGEMLDGQMEAASDGEVALRLQEQGHLPVEAKLASEGGGESTWRALFKPKPFSGARLVQFTQQLATLLGAGQPLDATRYFIIIPDALGHGQSSKPSDGLRAKFPRYNYDDMVFAHHRLLTEHLGIKHLRLVMGNSMGGMHAWIWGATHPGFMDALVPMASQPTEMSSRNWMMRRLIIDSIRNDPDYNGGNYTAQPKSAQFASVFYGIGTNGGDLAYQKAAPTRDAADKLLDARLKAPFRADANDVLYQWDSSRDYNPSPKLERIEAALLAINAADDERNPPETGILERELKRVKNGKLFLIPASENTAGHGTTGSARHYTQALRDFMQSVPKRVM